LAVVVGIKKTNDHAEPTKSNAKKIKIKLNNAPFTAAAYFLLLVHLQLS